MLVLPSGLTSRIERIDTADGPVDEARPAMAVTIVLADDLDISRGDMICRPHNQPTPTQDLDAMVAWMDSSAPLALRQIYTLKHTTRTVRAMVTDLRYRLDVHMLHRDTDGDRARSSTRSVGSRSAPPPRCSPTTTAATAPRGASS